MRFYCIIENRAPRSSQKLWPIGKEVSKSNCLLGRVKWWANSSRHILSALWVLRDVVQNGFSSKSLKSRKKIPYTFSLHIPLGDFSRSPVKFFYAFFCITENRTPRSSPKLWLKLYGLCEVSFNMGFQQKFENPVSQALYGFTAYSVRRFFSEPSKMFLCVFTV